MEFEIAIEGPSQEISRLCHRLKAFSPVEEKIPSISMESGEKRRILLKESNENRLDEKLLILSKAIREYEKEVGVEDLFTLRVRNLAYSEPPSGSAQYKKPFQPVPSLTIQPWSPSLNAVQDDNIIILDPSHAFGTGKHPTTRLCLRIMERLSKTGTRDNWLRDRSVLDFGCGTGLLSIAAVKMGAKTALGVEIASEPADTAKKNVAFNGLSEKIEIRKGSWEVVSRKYDIIFANLVTSTLLKVGRYIPKYLKDHGMAVVSGFGENQIEDMSRHFEGAGMSIDQNFKLEKWVAFIMMKQQKDH